MCWFEISLISLEKNKVMAFQSEDSDMCVDNRSRSIFGKTCRLLCTNPNDQARGSFELWLNKQSETVQKRFDSVEIQFKRGKLYINGDLNLSNCKDLISLPEVLAKVKGDLQLDDCSNLIGLPDALSEVRGELILNRCHKLAALPSNLRVNKLYIIECNNLTQLPRKLSVREIYMERCNGITSFPEDTIVQLSISLFECSRLMVFSNITVQNNIDINATSLESINNITAGRNITITHCGELNELSNISAGSSIDIINCNNITGGELQNSLSFQNNLTLNRCSGITELPESLLRSLDQSHTIILEQTGIPIRLLQTYSVEQNTAGYTGAQFQFSILDDAAVVQTDASKLKSWVQQITNLPAAHPFWTYAETQLTPTYNNFANFIRRLLNELPQENTPNCMLISNLSRVIKRMEEEYDLKEGELNSCEFINQVLTTAEMSIATCEDRVKVGYIILQLLLDNESSDNMSKMQMIIDTVNQISTAELVFDKASHRFISIMDLAGESKFNDRDDIKALIDVDHHEFNMEMDINTRRQALVSIIDEVQVIRVGDPVEDILNLVYQIFGDNFHKVSMRYQGCCTLVDGANGQRQQAALDYIDELVHKAKSDDS